MGFGIAFYLVETFMSRSFNITFFNMGINIKKTTISLAGSKIEIPRGIKLDLAEGKFYFSNDGKVYFLSQYFWFKMFRAETPFPVRSVGTFRYDESIEIVSKIPLGSCLFMGFFFIVWIIFAIEAQSNEMILAGSIVLIYMAVFGYFVERKRLNIMIEELKSIIVVNYSPSKINY